MTQFLKRKETKKEYAKLKKTDKEILKTHLEEVRAQEVPTERKVSKAELADVTQTIKHVGDVVSPLYAPPS